MPYRGGRGIHRSAYIIFESIAIYQFSTLANKNNTTTDFMAENRTLFKEFHSNIARSFRQKADFMLFLKSTLRTLIP